MIGFFNFALAPIEFVLTGINFIVIVLSMIPPVFGVLLTLAVGSFIIRLLPL